MVDDFVNNSVTMETVCAALPELELLHVKGRDAVKVLNGLCTAKLVELQNGQTCEAFFTDDRGRVLAHCAVGKEENGLWLAALRMSAAQLNAHIDRFIFREDATPRVMTGNYSAVILDGEWERLFETTDPALLRTPLALNVSLQGLTVELMRFPLLSEDSTLCLVKAEDAGKLAEILSGSGVKSLSQEQVESARVWRGWPVKGSEITERTLPQELDRDKIAISFTKGCYLGQETVARLDAMGEVQKKLCKIEFSGSEPIGVGEAFVVDGKEIGKISSIAPLLKDGRRCALAYMRRGYFSADTQFDWSSGTVTVHPIQL